MKPLRAFIVEDNPVILSNLVATLEELTEVTVVAHAGNERDAVRDIGKLSGQLDLVIVDLFLHAGNGLGVLKFAQDHALSAQRVVLTNYATAEMRRRCMELGATRVFDKSGEIDELLAYCDSLSGD